MLCAVEYIEVVHQRATQRTLGQHAFDGVADHLVDAVLALAQLGGCVEALTAWIASIACVDLVGLLLAGEDDFGSVDDDDVVTAVYVRSEVGFVLSAEQLGDLGAQTTHDLVSGVDNDPLFLCCFLVSGNSLVT